MNNSSSSQYDSSDDERIQGISKPASGPEIKKKLEQGEVEQLRQSGQKLSKFALRIKNLKKTPLRLDVIQHCDKVKCNKRELFTYQNIEKLVQNRIDNMIKNKKIKRNWGAEDIHILVWVVSKYSEHIKINRIQRDLKKQDWKEIADMIPGTNGQNCMFKWLSLKKIKLIDNSWSQRQSILLRKLVQKFGDQDWNFLSQQLYYSNQSDNKVYRGAKQCKEHWNCFLKQNIKKGLWQKQEDYLLLSEIKKNGGQKKWTQLAKLLGGRTQNAIKNRYNLIIQKLRKLLPNGQNIQQRVLIDYYLQNNQASQIVNNSQIKQQKSNPLKKVVKDGQASQNNNQLLSGQQKNQIKIKKQDSPSNIGLKNKILYSSFPDFPVKIEEDHIIQLNSFQMTPTLNNSNTVRLNSQSAFLAPEYSYMERQQMKQESIMEMNKKQQQNKQNPKVQTVVKMQYDQFQQNIKQMTQGRQYQIVLNKNKFQKVEKKDE